MPPGDVAPLLISSILAVVIGAVLIFRGPLGKALARRIEGSVDLAPEFQARLDDLENRLVESERDRAELSERLEFAERILLQAKNEAREIGR